MNSQTSWTREEMALDELVRSRPGLLAVSLVDAFHPGSQLMAERARRIAAAIPGGEAVDASLGSVRRWAAGQGALGVPTIIVFRGGRRLGRILGVLPEEALRERIREFAPR